MLAAAIGGYLLMLVALVGIDRATGWQIAEAFGKVKRCPLCNAPLPPGKNNCPTCGEK